MSDRKPPRSDIPPDAPTDPSGQRRHEEVMRERDKQTPTDDRPMRDIGERLPPD